MSAPTRMDRLSVSNSSIRTSPTNVLSRAGRLSMSGPGTDDTANLRLITQELRARNLFLNNSIAFVSTNLFTYFVNVRRVFKRGRHGVFTEFLFFTAVNLASFLLSQVAGPLLVREWNLPTSVAIATHAVAALLINFASRKFLIFQR